MGELHGVERPSEAVEGAGEQSVVRADQDAPLGGRHGDSPALGTDTRVDHGEVHPRRAGGQRVGEGHGALPNVLAGDPVGEVDQRRAGGDL